MRKIYFSFLLLPSLFCGCASYKSQTEQYKAQWIAGNTEVAAQIATDEAQARSDSRDAIVWRLEQGAALRASGQFEESNKAFKQAEEKIAYYREVAAKVRVGKEAVSAVTNLAAIPYEGYGYDRVMLHTYKALNFLQLGDREAAGVEFRSAENAQEAELDRNKTRLEKARKEAEENQSVSLSTVNSESKLDIIRPNIEDDYGNYGNPFKDFVYAMYLATDSDRSIRENAPVSLRRVNSNLGGNPFIEEEIKLANKNLSGNDNTRRTYVIYESGLAPVREEVRLDIPTGDRNIPYVAAAFPKLAFQGQPVSMTVQAGNKDYSSTRLSNMDAIIAQEFKNELPGVIARTVVSAAVKAAATKVAADKGGDFGLIAGMLYQAGSTQADLRTWLSLPKEFHVCSFETPSDNAVNISTSGGGTAEITVSESQINIVYVKDFGPNTGLRIAQFSLR